MDYTQELTPAVIYARYSSSGQREESIEGQRALCAVLLFFSAEAYTARFDIS